MNNYFKELYCKSKGHSNILGVPCWSVIFDFLHARCCYGFCGEDYFLNSSGYAMKNFQKKDFFSYKKWIWLRKRLNQEDYIHILNNKVETLKYFKEYIHHNWIYPAEATLSEYNKFLFTTNEVICKPISEEGGAGVVKYSNFTKTNKSFDHFRKENVLLEECIQQHPKMYFNNTSVNTIRVYTILDKNGDVHVLKAILRAGVGNTVVDNFHSGGVIYPVNVKYGFIESYGVRRNSSEEIFIHPETNLQMIGFKIPNWDIMIKSVVKMAKLIPQVRYIGWDMVITPNGVDLIEANDTADHALFGRVGSERLFWNKLKSLI